MTIFVTIIVVPDTSVTFTPKLGVISPKVPQSVGVFGGRWEAERSNRLGNHYLWGYTVSGIGELGGHRQNS